MADAMRGATKAMGAMNKQMNLPALTKIMREFERQNEKMEMTSEMMGDAVDDAFEVCSPAQLLECLSLPHQSTCGVCLPCKLFCSLMRLLAAVLLQRDGCRAAISLTF